VISYGDLLFRSYILRDLVESDSDFCVVVDSSQTPHAGEAATDFAYCSAADDRALFGRKVWLEGVVSTASAPGRTGSPQGRWMGLLNVRGAARERLLATLAQLQQRDDFNKLDMAALLNALVEAGERIEVHYVHGHWRGVNDLDDFRRAGDFAHAQAPYGSSGAAPGGSRD
jgi:phosphoenolpyruvate phosphomutase